MLISVELSTSICNARYIHQIAQLCSQVCVTVPNFTVVSTFIWSVSFHFHWCGPLVCPVIVANRLTGARKICFSITLLWGSHTKHCWAAERTFNMSGYFSSPFWINTGRPSILGCCLKAHLWKVLRHWLKGLWNIGTSPLRLRLNCFQHPVWTRPKALSQRVRKFKDEKGKINSLSTGI